MAFKIAISAGHCLTTAGKRLPKKLDPNQTREWVLNDRVARYVEEAAAQYEGVEILRLDNRDGSKGNDNTKRAKKATDWGADFLIDIHHNAGILLGKGGGIVAFCHKKNTTAEKYRNAIYAACIDAGGLKGNRATPKQEKAYTILKKFKGAGVLMEYGFMDSKTDAPVILTEAYAKLVGYATMEGIAKVARLKKKAVAPKEPTKATAATTTKKATDGAKSFLKSLAGTYKVTATSLNVRNGAGSSKKKMVAIPKGTKVKCHGYYTSVLGTKWLYIQFTYNKVNYTGFASSKYLEK